MMQKPVSSEIPRGVGCPPPPGMDPRKGKGKLMCIKVRMLDDTVGVFHLGHKAMGQALFDEVCRHLNLLESDYFGLEFIDSYGNRCWLDKEKSILRQIMAAQSDARFFFIIKFYTPNPAELEEEYTRYLFALQLRRDLARGELLCNENTAAMLVACIVQSECGDFSPLDYPDPSYLAAAQFVPNQSPAFQLKVMEQHKKLVGMSPAEADFNLLETTRRCDFYGVRLHTARDLEGIEVSLAVVHMGIKVFHNLNCVTTFSWAKVRKLSFKRKRLMIKIHPDSNQQYKETIEFLFENRDDCKNFWKKCVEHHSFFRCPEPVEPRRESSRRLFHRGSHFHYQGRTQKQLIDYVREHRKRREPFERPLRRSGAPLSSANSTMLNHHPQNVISSSIPNYALQQNAPNQNQPQQRAFFVSDRIAGEYMLDGMAMNLGASMEPGQKHVNFPSICRQQRQQMEQNGGGGKMATKTTMMGGMGMANGAGNGGGGTRKPRPKSALLDNGAAHQNALQHQKKGIQMQNQPAHHDPMQQSCHGAILPVNPVAAAAQNGGHQQNAAAILARQQNSQQQQAAIAAFHQQMDPMSMSLPNVLAPSALQTDQCCFFAGGPLKSMSGENFHVMEQRRRENDNQSEGSYRIGPDPGGIVGGGGPLNSSQSDVGSTSTAPSSIDPRVFQTTFTTKRVGNVIVKKVTPAVGNNSGSIQPQQHRSASSSTSRPSGINPTRRHPQPQTQIPQSAPPNGQMVHGIVSPLEGIASGCSSTCCSDYSLASSSAPNSARSQGQGGGRLRYAPNSGGGNGPVGYGGFANKLRHEIPVAIDGPPPLQSASAGCTPSPIIRPVLLPSPPGRRQSASSASNSAQSTPTQSTIVPLNGRRPLVMKTPAANGNEGIGTKIVPITKLANAFSSATAPIAPSNSNDIAPSNAVQIGSPQGPLAGRVIRKEDLMITPNGIELKPTPMEGDKNVDGGNNGMEIGQPKPKVPPKPDLETLQFKIVQSLAIASTGQMNLQEEKEEQRHRALLDPLESILKDVQAINDALDGTFQSASTAKIPAAISIQSEERPDVKTVHLFNGGTGGNGNAPYTLTVRDLSARGGGMKETAEINQIAMGIGGRCEHSSRPGKSSIELVNRRRLPSQDSYSSQDHSISPTNADTGNVLEYVMRRRSQSSDRAVQGSGGGGQFQNPSKLSGGEKRRSAERRMTQPVEFGGGGILEEKKKENGGNEENGQKMKGDEGKSEVEAELNGNDGENAKNIGEMPKNDGIDEFASTISAQNESAKSQKDEGMMEAKRLLETDF